MKCLAVSNPIPLEAPVIKARFPVSLFTFIPSKSIGSSRRKLSGIGFCSG
jgi:hypothetical protein